MRTKGLLAVFLVVLGGLALIGVVILPFLTELTYVRPLAIFLFVLWFVFLGLAPIWFVILVFLAELKNLPERSRREQKKRLKWVLRQSAVGALLGAVWGAIFFVPFLGKWVIICGALIGALVGSIWAHVVESEWVI